MLEQYRGWGSGVPIVRSYCFHRSQKFDHNELMVEGYEKGPPNVLDDAFNAILLL